MTDFPIFKQELECILGKEFADTLVVIDGRNMKHMKCRFALITPQRELILISFHESDVTETGVGYAFEWFGNDGKGVASGSDKITTSALLLHLKPNFRIDVEN